jgi:hypothetical protein
MNKLLLSLHRWLALIFALPLLVVIGTGLVLSVEPSLVVASIKPGSLDAAKIGLLLSKYDPKGQARSIAQQTYDNTISFGGRGNSTIVDLGTGEAAKGQSTLSSVLPTSRRLHETLMLDAGWLVTASTVTMLVLALLGVLMGLPRINSSVSGWHKGIAWLLLPLVVLSPLIGLALVAGITLAGPAPEAARAGGGVPALAEAVRIVGREHDLSNLVSIRPLGGRMVARLAEDGEYRAYAVTRDGAVALPRNWPRLLHEGNFAGHISSLLNVITSLALLVFRL